MARGQLNKVIQRLQCLIGGTVLPDQSDGQLLERFAVQNDAWAFEQMLRRHAPMVYGVGQRVLNNNHDAEDVLQVTFLALARQAGSIRQCASLASWLYGVAYRTALKARRRASRRRDLETEKVAMPPEEVRDDPGWSELRPLLDEEVNRLPEKFRSPVVLCYLEGKTRQEAASQLGWSKDTVKGRLERARGLLRTRLTRRGLALSAAALAVMLEQQAVAAAIPASLLATCLETSTMVGPVSVALAPDVAALLAGVVREMYWNKVKLTLAVALTVAAAFAGIGWLAHRALAGPTIEVVALAPDPHVEPREAAREITLPIDRAEVHRNRAEGAPESSTVVSNSWGNHADPTPAFTIKNQAKPRLPAGGSLSILSGGLLLDGPDEVNVQKLTRQGRRIHLEINYTKVRDEGSELRRNVGWRPLVQAPVDLPVGEYELEVSWHAVASVRAGGNFKPKPTDVQKLSFTVYDGLVFSKPVRVNDVEYQTIMDGRLEAPAPGGSRPVHLGIRVTNHGKAPIACTTPAPRGRELTAVDGPAPSYAGGADGLRRRQPLLVSSGQSYNLFVRVAALVSDRDGKLTLSGSDAGGGFYAYRGVGAGKYAVRFQEGGVTTEPVGFEIVAAKAEARPARVNGAEFVLTAEPKIAVPAAGTARACKIALTVTNHADKDLGFFGITFDGVNWVLTREDGTEMPYAIGIHPDVGRWGPRISTMVPTGKSHAFEMKADLETAKDGTLQLKGQVDALLWTFKDLKPGKYRLRLEYEKKKVREGDWTGKVVTNSVPFEIGAGAEEKAEPGKPK